MAQKVHATLLDDIDGTNAAETVSFSLDGTRYEVDLSESNALDIRMALEPFIQVARKAKRSGHTRSQVRSHEQNQAIREWARERGLRVSVHGRLSNFVIHKYNTSI